MNASLLFINTLALAHRLDISDNHQDYMPMLLLLVIIAAVGVISWRWGREPGEQLPPDTMTKTPARKG